MPANVPNKEKENSSWASAFMCTNVLQDFQNPEGITT